MRNGDIMIDLIYYTDKNGPHCRIGIDPADCFESVQNCSIEMCFPITSKREEAQFYSTINALLDKRSVIAKEWFDRENATWTGKYMSNV